MLRYKKNREQSRKARPIAPRAWLLALFAVSLFSCTTAAMATPKVAQTAFGAGPVQVMGNEPSYLDVGLGVFNFNKRGPAEDNDLSALTRVEVRFGPKLLFIGPAAGVMVNSDGGVFGYVGVYTDIRYRHLVVTPVLAVGGYARGGSKLLGGIFQFRLSGTVSYEFSNHSRVSVTYAHISNGGIHHRNPSEQELMLTYAIPFALTAEDDSD